MTDGEIAQRALDRHVLTLMDGTPGEYAFPLSRFVSGWVTKEMARAACRSLTDRGYAFYMRGLWSEDSGMPAGAGYGVTEKGLAYLETLKTPISPEMLYEALRAARLREAYISDDGDLSCVTLDGDFDLTA